MSSTFKDKIVVIVPASQDCGMACARDFADQGADLFLVDASWDALEGICTELRDAGARVEGFVTDPSASEGLLAAAQACKAWRPVVHVLVTCHLQAEAVSIEDATPKSWRLAIDVNLLGPVFTIQAFLPLLKSAGAAAVVNVSSFDGIFGNAHLPLVSTVKGAISPLTHVAANEFARYGIRVNTIARGMTALPEQDDNPRFKHLIADTPLGRPARPHEIAASVRFLASPDAAYVTGTVLVVDGGRTAITPGTRRMDLSGSSPMWTADVRGTTPLQPTP